MASESAPEGLTAPAATAEPTTAELRAIEDIYDRGLYVQAWKASLRHGPLKSWRGTKARVLAGRLAGNLGAPRLGNVHHLRAWRQDPTDRDALYFYTLARMRRWGVWQTLRFMKRFGDLPDATPVQRADWLSLRARFLSYLRDFEAAEADLAAASRLAPELVWILEEKASLLERQDRVVEALAVAREALRLRPWYRPAVHTAGHLLGLLGRDQEALEFLSEAVTHLESCSVMEALARLQLDMEKPEDAIRSWERSLELAVLKEPEHEEDIAGCLSDACYAKGDYQAACEQARKSKRGFFIKTSENIEKAPATARRVVLPVGFVRQNHLTCAPATLSAISGFWSRPADHLQVAERICYDGTPWHSERQWAEKNRYFVREFTLTWDSAVELLDRGIPFTLTTVQISNSHLQAVIGYDSRRGTLIIREPSMPHHGEFMADVFLENYRHCGPRGMALVPFADSERLLAVELPDAPLYDTYFRMQSSLLAHDRARARMFAEELERQAPGHHLAIKARSSLADYDRDTVTRLACDERLIQLFPEEPIFRRSKIHCLRRLGKRTERVALLEELCAKPGSPPELRHMLADELADDAASWSRAEKFFRTVVRERWSSADSYYGLAGLLWSRRQTEEAAELYRAATCLDDKDEDFAQAWFRSESWFHREGTAVEFLRRRFERLKTGSSAPAHTLTWALARIGRVAEAFQVLEEAARARPQDGDLLLYAATTHARWGSTERASAFLEQARGRTRDAEWFRTAAILAEWSGKPEESLALWTKVLEHDCLHTQAHESVVALLDQTRGRAAAMEHVDSVIARFPQNRDLHHVRLKWLAEEAPEPYERGLRAFLDIEPRHGWALRELASLLARLKRFEESTAVLKTAFEADPNPSWYNVAGYLEAQAGRLPEARELFRKAIALASDNSYAIRRLMEFSETQEEKRASLEFVRQELLRSAGFGEGVHAYMMAARAVMTPEQVLPALRGFRDAAPEMPHFWSCEIQQLAEMDRMTEARDLVAKAIAKFPMSSRLLIDAAQLERYSLDHDAEIRALREALRIDPDNGQATRQLSEALATANRFEEARVVLEGACARDPMERANHGFLAEVLWKLGAREAAIKRLERAIELDPEYAWAWGQLRDWRELEGDSEKVLDLARDSIRRNPKQAYRHMILARLLSGYEHLAERLALVDEALQLEPRNLETHDYRARLLAEARRFDDAVLACRPAAFGKAVPVELQAREAWVEALRGRRGVAICRMKEILKAEPGYAAGWTSLAGWYEEEQDFTGYNTAANALVRLTPNSPVALGYRASGLLRTADRLSEPGRSDHRKIAMADLRKALELDPSYVYAAVTLFEMHEQEGDLQAAKNALDRFRKHVPAEQVHLAEFKLAIRARNRGAALAHIRSLCREKGVSAWSLRRVCEAMRSAMFTNELKDVLVEEGSSETVEATVVRCAVIELATWREWARARKFLDGLRGENRGEGVAGFVTILAERREERVLRQYVRKQGPLIQSNTVAWGATLNALSEFGLHRQVVTFLGNWRNRKDAMPGMLLPAVTALCEVRRFGEALEVARAALALPPDGAVPALEALAALSEALDGSPANAAALVSRIKEDTLAPYYRFLFLLARALTKLEKGRALHEAKMGLDFALGQMSQFRLDALQKRAYFRCVGFIGRRQGGVPGIWYRVWKRLAGLLTMDRFTS